MRPSAGFLVFMLSLALYLSLAAVLVFGANVILGDALARVASAYRILFSRDPHLAAIGFVWSPLPPLADLPLLLFKGIWPALAVQGFAGNIVSALFMAGSVFQLRALLKDLRIQGLLLAGLTVAFALHPMILFFGVNGMSEASEVFFLILAARYFTRWLDNPGVGPLVGTGFAMAGAYLSRYEPLAGGFAVIGLVLAITYFRSRGTKSERGNAAICDATLVAAPFLLAVGVWALTSLVITGQLFEQSSSAYGTTAQLNAIGASNAGGLASFIDGSLGIVSLEPLLLVVVAAAAVRILVKRDLRPLAPLGLLGPVVLFMLWAYVNAAVLRSLRYFIVAIPMTIILVGLLASPAGSRTWGLSARFTVRHRPSITALSVLAIASLLFSWPTAVQAMYNRTVNPSEAAALGALGARVTPRTATKEQRRALRRYETEHAIARYLDRIRLPDGTVLVDDFSAFAVVLASDHPRQFVITADRDYEQILAHPARSGVRYILVPSSQRLGVLDAIVRAYPGIYDTGAGLGELVQEFKQTGDSGIDWRLYRLTGSGAAPLAVLAAPAIPLVIGVDNASPAGHNYMYVTFYPKSGVTVHGTNVVDFHLNAGSADGLHTISFPKQGDTNAQVRAAHLVAVPDFEDGPGSLVANPVVVGPSNPACGGAPGSACSYDGTAFLNSGAMPAPLGGHFYVAMNVTATQTPVTVHFLCLLHPGMEGSLTVDDTQGAVARTQAQLDTATAIQYASDTAAGNAAEATANNAGSTTNADGTQTWTMTAGAAAPDVEVLEMLPSTLDIHTGDKVTWTTTTLADIHTVTFPNDETSTAVDPLAASVCEGGPPDTTPPAPGTPPGYGCAGGPPNAEHPIVPRPQGPTTLAGPATVASSGILSTPNGAPFPDNYTFTFASAGTYTYLCRIHNHMVGSVLAANVVAPTFPAAGAGPARGVPGG
jgi:plastocyanin